MSVRVHELAKELKITSKELIERLKTLRIDAKSHMSLLTDENVRKLREGAAPKKAQPAPSQPPSIASVRKEFLIQRGAAKASTEVRKARVEPPHAAPVVRRVVAPTPPSRPKPAAPEIKKQPARPIEEKAPVPPVAEAAPEVKKAR
ncbi:MAG: translation initiation factor IF-2 N-terminal domain-containing protein, partial [Candidatus Omnitrophota bacterium]